MILNLMTLLIELGAVEMWHWFDFGFELISV